MRLLTLFVASIYFWAGLAKVQWEWLSGHALETQARAGAFAGPLGAWVGQRSLRGVASVVVPIVELTLAALLVADRRRLAIVLALAFHVAVELTVNPDTLGWQMAVLLLAIWPREPSRSLEGVERALARVRGCRRDLRHWPHDRRRRSGAAGSDQHRSCHLD